MYDGIKCYHTAGDYQLTKAELILRADEMNKGANIEIHELIEVQDD